MFRLSRNLSKICKLTQKSQTRTFELLWYTSSRSIERPRVTSSWLCGTDFRSVEVLCTHSGRIQKTEGQVRSWLGSTFSRTVSSRFGFVFLVGRLGVLELYSFYQQKFGNFDPYQTIYRFQSTLNDIGTSKLYFILG